MKLIIDIPDEVLESKHYCRYFGAWSTKLTEIIENGTPYEERPQGEWVDEGQYAEGHSEHAYICKGCGYQIIEKPNRIFENRFCKYCGAKMKGGAEE